MGRRQAVVGQLVRHYICIPIESTYLVPTTFGNCRFAKTFTYVMFANAESLEMYAA